MGKVSGTGACVATVGVGAGAGDGGSTMGEGASTGAPVATAEVGAGAIVAPPASIDGSNCFCTMENISGQLLLHPSPNVREIERDEIKCSWWHEPVRSICRKRNLALSGVLPKTVFGGKRVPGCGDRRRWRIPLTGCCRHTGSGDLLVLSVQNTAMHIGYVQAMLLFEASTAERTKMSFSWHPRARKNLKTRSVSEPLTNSNIRSMLAGNLWVLESISSPNAGASRCRR